MDIQVITDPSIGSRNNNGFAIGDETDVANKGFIKNLKHRGAVVFGSLWQPFQRSSVGWGKVRQVVYSNVIVTALAQRLAPFFF